MNEYIKGSEWRRWDLHLHTPGTIKNDLFTGETLEKKWDAFYSDIVSYIGDGSDDAKNITVVGITDYLSIENYKKIINDNKLSATIAMIIANVEMRIQPIANDSPINIHFLFNPWIIDSVENRFFAQLSFRYGTTNFSATKPELIRLGKTIDPSLSDEIAYKKGVEQFVPSFSDIVKIFSNDVDLRENTIILVSNSSSDGVSGAANHSHYFESDSGESQLKLFRQSIYKFVDGIFSANQSDIDFFLGRRPNCPIELVVSQCGSLKPCLHGSDAHKNSKMFEPDLKRYCWIKADPTFAGLKQVIYEPEERVMISEIKPEVKPAYLVINRIEISNSDFQNTPIFFSDKLNCIIGGKSTGKSILLHNIALSLDRKQVEIKDETSQTRTKKDVKISVYWADGKGSEDTTLNEKKIIYVPQTYLNKLCDEQTEKTEIDEIIQEIILLNYDAKQSYDRTILSIKNYKSESNKVILDLLEVCGTINEITMKIKELGDKEGINDEREKLIKEKERLTKDSSLTEEEVKSYENAILQITSLINDIRIIDDELLELHSLTSLVESKRIDYRFSEQTQNLIDIAQKHIIIQSNEEWGRAKIELIRTLANNKLKKNEELSKYQTIEADLKDKIQSNKAISELTEKIKSESEKLTMFERYEMDMKEKTQEKVILLQNAINSKEFYKEQHIIFANAINNNSDLKTKDLEFSVEVPFRKDAFIEKLKSIMDTSRKVFKDFVSLDNFNEKSYTSNKIYELVEKILSGELILRKGYTPEVALRDILDDWFEVKYRVTMGNDSIELMSPGKKALVLLKLLIELAESKCPILIDQPEDDLDNRSIFDELIPFVKRKKKDRQFIIVTHNANIVLGADAEQIIVANQEGKNAPNKQFKFEYRSGSIENDCKVIDKNGNVEKGILNSQGIQQHVCDILEGGKEAFVKRKHKYHM